MSAGLGAELQETKPCRYCGEEILASARKCRYCGEYLDEELRRENRSDPDFFEVGEILPTNQPASAVFSLYLGLVSILPPFCFIAVLVALFALRTLKREPRFHGRGRGRAIFGLVMGCLFSALWAFCFLMIFLEQRSRGH